LLLGNKGSLLTELFKSQRTDIAPWNLKNLCNPAIMGAEGIGKLNPRSVKEILYN